MNATRTVETTNFVETTSSRREVTQGIEEWAHELRRAAMRLTSSPEDAEDLFQETCLRALRSCGQFHAGSNCRAWLHRIQKNLFISNYRRRAMGREIMEIQRHTPVSSLVCSDSQDRFSNPERILRHRHMPHELVQAIADLPDTFRTVVTRVDLQEMSYQEVADSMGTPIGTVMSRLHRGRRILRERLRPYAEREGFTVAQAAA